MKGKFLLAGQAALLQIFISRKFLLICRCLNLNLDTDEEKKAKEEKRKEKEEESKSLLETIKKYLGSEVSEVRLSSRLKNSAVCLVSGAGLSLNMEQVLSEATMSSMPSPKAQRILEINPDHKIFEKLTEIYNADPESPKLKDMA